MAVAGHGAVVVVVPAEPPRQAVALVGLTAAVVAAKVVTVVRLQYG